MSVKLDEFKDFVRRHPLLKNEVAAKKKTWQSIYEDYVLLGESGIFDAYKETPTPKEASPPDSDKTKSTTSKPSTEDIVKTVVGYVKKIDPDQVTKTVTSIQKVLELLGSFGAGATVSAAAKKSTGDPLFDRKFDEWY